MVEGVAGLVILRLRGTITCKCRGALDRDWQEKVGQEREEVARSRYIREESTCTTVSVETMFTMPFVKYVPSVIRLYSHASSGLPIHQAELHQLHAKS